MRHIKFYLIKRYKLWSLCTTFSWILGFSLTIRYKVSMEILYLTLSHIYSCHSENPMTVGNKWYFTTLYIRKYFSAKHLPDYESSRWELSIYSRDIGLVKREFENPKSRCKQALLHATIMTILQWFSQWFLGWGYTFCSQFGRPGLVW